MKSSLLAAVALISSGSLPPEVSPEEEMEGGPQPDPDLFEEEVPVDNFKRLRYADDFLQKIEITVADTFLPEYVPVEPHRYGVRKKRTSWK